MKHYPDLFRSWPAYELLVSHDRTTGIAVFFNIKCATTRRYRECDPVRACSNGPATPSTFSGCRPEWVMAELDRRNATVEPEARRWAELVEEADRRGVTTSACRNEFIELVTAQAARFGQLPAT